jgi:hypothetical protein
MGYLRKKNGVSVYGPEMIAINTDGGLNVLIDNFETSLGSLTIPANTFVTGDCINIVSRIVKTTTNGTTAIRMRIGTTGTVSDPLVGGYTASTNTDTIIPIFRTVCYYSGSTNYVLGPNENFCKVVSSTSSVSNVSIDWTVSNIITINGINTTAINDNANAMYIKTKVL